MERAMRRQSALAGIDVACFGSQRGGTSSFSSRNKDFPGQLVSSVQVGECPLADLGWPAIISFVQDRQFQRGQIMLTMKR